jgi:peptide/nickel transport system permease protein
VTALDVADPLGPPDAVAPPPGRLRRGILGSGEGRLAVAGLVLMALVIGVGPLVAPYAPDATNVGPALSGPSADHWLGTDDLGRDVLSRVLWGGGALVGAPMAGVLIAMALGGVVGIAAALRGGALDVVVTRVTDVMLVLPGLLLLIVLVTSLGQSTTTIVVGTVLVFFPVALRLVRGAAQTVVAAPYVEVARARGDSTWSVLRREVLPNIVGVVAVEVALSMVVAVLFVATLSYLGLGAAPPSSNWGLMVAEGRDLLRITPLVTLAPVACLVLVSVSLNLLADASHKAVTRDQSDASGVF